MTYAFYVYAAYAVFALVLAWDFIVTHLRIARVLRAARARAHRRSPRGARAATGDAP